MKRVTIVFLILALVGCSNGQVIEVSKTKSEPKQETHQNILLSVNDRQLLERFVETEANGEPYIAHVAVASVILNRLKHPDFPNKISNVVSQLNDISDKEITISDTTKKACSTIEERVEHRKGCRMVALCYGYGSSIMLTTLATGDSLGSLLS